MNFRSDGAPPYRARVKSNSKSRRVRSVLSLLLVGAIALPGCGDDTPTVPGAPGSDQAATPAPDAEPAPFETWFDDEALLARVSEAATGGTPAPLQGFTLPPRCSRVRVAVTALHWHLTNHEPGKPALDDLFQALEHLEQLEGGADSDGLADMLAAWREWTDDQLETESRLAGAASLARAVLTGDEPPDPQKLREAIALDVEPPPRSPGAALVSLVPLAIQIVESKGAVPSDIDDTLIASRHRFHKLGWPGGHATLLESLAHRELSDRPDGALGSVLVGAALDSYRQAGDAVRLAEMQLDRARAAVDPSKPQHTRSALDLALKLAGEAVASLDSVGARGRETYETLAFHGLLLQMVGRQRDAVLRLERAAEEARYAQLDAWLQASTGAVLARSLVNGGAPLRGAEAADRFVATFDEGVSNPAPRQRALRVELLQTAGAGYQAAGRHSDARARFLAAAQAAEADEARLPALQSRLFAAQNAALGGDSATGADEVAALLSAGVPPSAFAQAVEVLIESGRLDDAGRALEELAKRLGGGQTPALDELRARLAAARGDVDEASRRFSAFSAWMAARADGATGPLQARALLRWSESEERAGRLLEAEQLAWQAAGALQPFGWSPELDEARHRFATLARRRGSFFRALRVVESRVADPPLAAEAHGEAVVDAFLVQLELLTQGNAEYRDRAAKTAALHPDAETAAFLLAALAAYAEDGPAPVATEGSARLTRLAEALALRPVQPAGERATAAAKLARACGADEPETRRLAAELGIGDGAGVAPESVLELVELRRRPAPASADQIRAALAEGESLVVYERVGPGVALHVSADQTRGVDAPSRADLVDLWNLAHGFEADRDVTADELASRIAATLLPAGDGPVTISWDSVLGPLPIDGLRERRLVVVDGATERVLTGTRPRAPAEFLAHHAAPLTRRVALVGAGELSPDVRRRVVAEFQRAHASGASPWDAYEAALGLLRAEGGAGVPPARRVFLRGAR